MTKTLIVTYSVLLMYTLLAQYLSSDEIASFSRNVCPGDDIEFYVVRNLQVSWYYLPTPPLGQDKTQGQFLSGV